MSVVKLVALLSFFPWEARLRGKNSGLFWIVHQETSEAKNIFSLSTLAQQTLNHRIIDPQCCIH